MDIRNLLNPAPDSGSVNRAHKDRCEPPPPATSDPPRQPRLADARLGQEVKEQEEIVESAGRDPLASENAQTQHVESSDTEDWSYRRTASSSPEYDIHDDAYEGDASEEGMSEEDAFEDNTSKDNTSKDNASKDSTSKDNASKDDTSRSSTPDGDAFESDEPGHTTEEYAPDDPEFWGKAALPKRTETLRSQEPQVNEYPGLTFSTTESSSSETDEIPRATGHSTKEGHLPEIYDDSLS